MVSAPRLSRSSCPVSWRPPWLPRLRRLRPLGRARPGDLLHGLPEYTGARRRPGLQSSSVCSRALVVCSSIASPSRRQKRIGASVARRPAPSRRSPARRRAADDHARPGPAARAVRRVRRTPLAAGRRHRVVAPRRAGPAHRWHDRAPGDHVGDRRAGTDRPHPRDRVDTSRELAAEEGAYPASEAPYSSYSASSCSAS